MLEPGFYNMDCMEGMRQFPDKFFDLAVVDPPYGSGGVHLQAANGSESGLTATANAGGGTSPAGCGKDKVHRTGGTWAAKFAKKSSRGT